MKILRGMTLVVIGLALCVSSFAQSTRDAAAIAVVQNAIAALGGDASINQISDCTTQGHFQNSSNPAASGTFTWQTAGNEFNYTTQTNTMNRTVVSGHGAPSDLQNSVSVLIGAHVARATLAWHIPGLVLLNELNNPKYSFSYVGQEIRQGTSVIHIQTGDNSDAVGSIVTIQDWYLDSSSFVPAAVAFRIPDPVDATRYTRGSLAFGTFTQVNGVLMPLTFGIVTGSGTRTVTITSTVFNSGLPPSTFDPPAGGSQ